MNVAVCHSPKFDAYTFLQLKMDRLLTKLDKAKLTILTRKQDKLVDKFCFDRRYNFSVYQPNEKEEDMLKEADVLVTFQLDKDPELAQLMKLAKKKGVKVREIKCPEPETEKKAKPCR